MFQGTLFKMLSQTIAATLQFLIGSFSLFNNVKGALYQQTRWLYCLLYIVIMQNITFKLLFVKLLWISHKLHFIKSDPEMEQMQSNDYRILQWKINRVLLSKIICFYTHPQCLFAIKDLFNCKINTMDCLSSCFMNTIQLFKYLAHCSNVYNNITAIY